ncbi:hypothetical protein D0C36_22940 [Mucilaginibacter conchicola]|uniref:Uncharacterized protein n=1 Tax=Mucilaginibacter conchicola TaxID=2303333 RepID=A0A372NMD3_9SPHI|nr:hypothetical protein [Mucilaginibacter conchicola]RFZ90101.1 hypothetical protein D0C36_22940 [Mucilaginibacter conchicola]
MAKSKTDRKIFIDDVRKGKHEPLAFHAFLKYNFSEKDRAFILSKFSGLYYNYAYSFPKPSSHLIIGKHSSFTKENPDLLEEFYFLIETLRQHRGEINNFLKLNAELEHLVLSGDFERCFEILDKMDAVLGHSFHSLLCEYYINEIRGDNQANHKLLSYLNSNQASMKLLILMNLTRYRIDQNVSSLQYEGSIEQHTRLYDPIASAHYIDYIFFKFDNFNFDHQIKNYPFIIGFDSDFSVVDRYQTLKRILPIILADVTIDEEIKLKIVDTCVVQFANSKDIFWTNFRALYGKNQNIDFTDRSNFRDLQDKLVERKYKEATEHCFSVLSKHPEYSELYVPYVQAIIASNNHVSNIEFPHYHVKEILELMEEVLQKGPNYLAAREKLLKRFFMTAHFEFSTHILEFIYNEYNIAISQTVQLISFLNSAVLRYNSFKVFKNDEKLIALLQKIPHRAEQYLIRCIEGYIQPASNYLSAKIAVGYLMKKKRYSEALEFLLSIATNTSVIHTEYMRSWLKRNIVKAYALLNELGKAADIIVEDFFERGFVLEYLGVPSIFSRLQDPFETTFSHNLSIPIMLELYRQPQSVIYDAIANHLVAFGLFKPSELIAQHGENPSKYFQYFLEKCCVMENLEDSPFFKTIELLEEERIKILNYLKGNNSEKVELYNKEIRTIAQNVSLRKGLLQIHESRIYVDEAGILRTRLTHFKELYAAYDSLNDINQLHLTGLKLNTDQSITPIDSVYFFKTPIEIERLNSLDETYDHELDENAVSVPLIKYSYYLSIFGFLRDFFIKDEDYGFKGFLSMRIRHGTFSNVLRTVFEKYHLVSSKESNSNQYQEVRYWNDKLENTLDSGDLQSILKSFSSNVDIIIEDALSWLVINDSEVKPENASFDFFFSDKELFDLYRNRIGRLTNFDDFISELFKILFERLENCLSALRPRIAQILSDKFVASLHALDKQIESLNLNKGDYGLINHEILTCTTEIQVVTTKIENWFRISKNKYIERFPISLITETIVNYINQIYADALIVNKPNIEIKCNNDIKGRYFEPLGDLFINIFENILSKNKDITDGRLNIGIDIYEDELKERLIIQVGNNVSEQKDEKQMQHDVSDAKGKISRYQNGTDVAFEKGSGFIKLCKNLSVDLDRKEEYNVLPDYSEDKRRFEVKIEFKTNNFFA